MMDTVKVRIAVAVAADGTWDSHGESVCDDDEALDAIEERGTLRGKRVSFIEAELPLPKNEHVPETYRAEKVT